MINLNRKLKIVAFGDSLTQGNAIGGEFENWTEIVSIECNVEVVNSGIGGNTTLMAKKRFKDDVLNHNPDIVFINFGMNDHLLNNYGENFVSLDDFEENICFFIDELRKINAIPVLFTPNYFIEGNEEEYYYSRHSKELYDLYGGALNVFDQYNNKLRDIALQKEVNIIDIRKECEKYNPLDFLRSMKNCNANDGVHPAQLGVRIYADCIKEYIANI